MKIIGMAGSGHRIHYVATISHDEIEKVLGLYYNQLKHPLKVDEIINISEGYDFRNDIVSAFKGMTEAMEKFDKARTTLMAFAAMVSNLPPELQQPVKVES